MKPIEFRGKETMSYNKTEQPAAEGAEEIEAELRGYARDIVRLHKPIMEVNPQLAMDSIGNDLVKMFNRLAQRIADKMVSERYEIAIKALETIHHAYYTEGESAEEQMVDLRSITLKALEEIDNLKTN